jgi:AcrR family transcriptional regulator
VKAKRAAKPVGRPRSFDEEQALDRAMDVFWRKGFEGASLNDLVAAMGMKPPSIYAAFGNKLALFEKVLERYQAEQAPCLRQSLEEPTALAAAETVLRQTARFLTRPNHPRGCLVTQTALACGDEAEPVHRLLIEVRGKMQESLCERFERAKVEGDLCAGADPDGLARFVVTLVQGMAVQAVGGASYEELLGVAAMALRAWPGSPVSALKAP